MNTLVASNASLRKSTVFFCDNTVLYAFEQKSTEPIGWPREWVHWTQCTQNFTLLTKEVLKAQLANGFTEPKILNGQTAPRKKSFSNGFIKPNGANGTSDFRQTVRNKVSVQ